VDRGVHDRSVLEVKRSERANVRVIVYTILAMLVLSAPVVCAHEIDDHDGDHDGVVHPDSWHELARTWGWEPGSIAGLALSAGAYSVGLARYWRSAGVGGGIRKWQAASFAAGWFTLFVALVSPLHPWGSVLFSAHMVQHELLMIVAAPLIVLGQPMLVMLKALPANVSGTLARWGNSRPWQTFWRFITQPFVAWVIHFLALWMWHIPVLFDATLHSEWIHAAQHTSFLFSALLFWWAVVHGHNRALGYGMAVLYMFTTAMHSGILGAMITFASGAWYPSYQHTTESWGLTPLEDQQLGGLIMWIPAGLVYIVAGLTLFVAWLRESDRRVRRRESEQLVAMEGSS
jgi:putative membrane protein